MAIAPVNQPRDQRPFVELLYRGKCREIASRISSAAAHCFQNTFIESVYSYSLRWASPFFSPNMGLFEKLSIIRRVTVIPADQKLEIVRMSLGFIVPGMDGFERGRVIQWMTALPADKRKMLSMALGFEWIAVNTEEELRNNIIDSLADLHPLQAIYESLFLDLAHLLEGITVVERSVILRLILNSGIPRNQMPDLIRNVTESVNDQMNGEEKIAIVEKQIADQRRNNNL